jgi:hypothetical protein
MEEPENGSGRKSWHDQIKNGISRENIYQFFIKTANDENNKIAFEKISEIIDVLKDRPVSETGIISPKKSDVPNWFMGDYNRGVFRYLYKLYDPGYLFASTREFNLDLNECVLFVKKNLIKTS